MRVEPETASRPAGGKLVTSEPAIILTGLTTNSFIRFTIFLKRSKLFSSSLEFFSPVGPQQTLLTSPLSIILPKSFSIQFCIKTLDSEDRKKFGDNFSTFLEENLHCPMTWRGDWTVTPPFSLLDGQLVTISSNHPSHFLTSILI